jgi:hypothetical protein
MKIKVFETFNDKVLCPNKCLKNKYFVQILPSSTSSSSMSATLLASSPENITLYWIRNKKTFLNIYSLAGYKNVLATYLLATSLLIWLIYDF